MAFEALPAAALLLMLAPSVRPDESALADVKVTQKYLVPVCLNTAPIKPGERNWRLAPRAQSLAFTMRNDPHPGAAPHQQAPEPEDSPGVAAVSFTPKPGHKYEVEVRASAPAFASRVWERGKWTPVVRDRTVDRMVSGEPVWRNAECSVP